MMGVLRRRRRRRIDFRGLLKRAQKAWKEEPHVWIYWVSWGGVRQEKGVPFVAKIRGKQTKWFAHKPAGRLSWHARNSKSKVDYAGQKFYLNKKSALNAALRRVARDRKWYTAKVDLCDKARVKYEEQMAAL